MQYRLIITQIETQCNCGCKKSKWKTAELWEHDNCIWALGCIFRTRNTSEEILQYVSALTNRNLSLFNTEIAIGSQPSGVRECTDLRGPFREGRFKMEIPQDFHRVLDFP